MIGRPVVAPRAGGHGPRPPAPVRALRDERVTSVLIGASGVGQLEDNVAALDGPPLTDDEPARIDVHAVESGIDLWARSSDAG